MHIYLLKGVDSMSTKSTKVQSTMIVRFKDGVNAKGDDVIKGQRFSKIKVNALDADIFEVGTAIGSLLRFPVVQIVREDENNIVNE